MARTVKTCESPMTVSEIYEEMVEKFVMPRIEELDDEHTIAQTTDDIIESVCTECKAKHIPNGQTIGVCKMVRETLAVFSGKKPYAFPL